MRLSDFPLQQRRQEQQHQQRERQRCVCDDIFSASASSGPCSASTSPSTSAPSSRGALAMGDDNHIERRRPQRRPDSAAVASSVRRRGSCRGWLSRTVAMSGPSLVLLVLLLPLALVLGGVEGQVNVGEASTHQPHRRLASDDDQAERLSPAGGSHHGGPPYGVDKPTRTSEATAAAIEAQHRSEHNRWGDEETPEVETRTSVPISKIISRGSTEGSSSSSSESSSSSSRSSSSRSNYNSRTTLQPIEEDTVRGRTSATETTSQQQKHRSDHGDDVNDGGRVRGGDYYDDVAERGNDVMFSNEFVVRMPGSVDRVKRLAELHGYTYLGPMNFDDLHHVRHRRLSRRSTNSVPHNVSEPWLEKMQQQIKVRTKRDYGGVHGEESAHLWKRWQRESDEDMQKQMLGRNAGSNNNDSPSTSHDDARGFILRRKRAMPFRRERERTPMNDPKWPLQWYLNRGGGLDMNVERAWSEFNVSGKGVVVTILDDGLETDHPDIQENYDADASYDMNDQDPNPQPRYESTDMNRHGTRCAGEVAGLRDNRVCGVGIAYRASIGGIRMLDGDVTDAVEARSLSLNLQHVHIYSASWGPDDDAKTVDGPGQLADRALKDGIRNGRKGLGSIFVWASGNGGKEKDNCNCDGYVNSIYTLAVSAATENGNVPWYSESCAASLATTYSSGNYNEGQIVTSDLHHNCTERHTGTSASAPLAAAIVALALEANPRLTWRDMQHLAVRATKRANLNAPDWVTNGAGRNVSHSFGFGLLDAHRMVELARRWRRSPPPKLCTVSTPRNEKAIPAKSTLLLHLYVECKNLKYVEHTISKITLQAVRRGDLHIYLTSPAGTRSTLLTMRPRDDSRQGFNQWPFMTVHNWGENPNGNWTLEIHNEGAYLGKATLREWALTLYGTAEDPDAQLRSDIPEKPAGEIDPSNDLGGTIESSSGVRSTGFRDQNCTDGWYEHTTPTGEKLCAHCHYSCQSCTGPNDYECRSCYPDAALHSGGYCYNKNLLEQIAAHWYWLNALLTGLTISSVLCIALACALVYLACSGRGSAVRQHRGIPRRRPYEERT